MAQTEVPLTGTADANGDAILSITPYRRQVWVVSQVSVEAETAPAEATAVVRKGDFLISPLVAHGDSADGDPPIVLRPGERLSVTWAGCNSGDQVRAIFIYDDGT